MRLNTLRTSVLDIAYQDTGPTDGPVALLLHGWPDDATTWRGVATYLAAAGIRTVTPWLRGCGGTRFLSPDTLRDGRAEALTQDALDLMNGLGIERFAVVGHDWGARTAYALAAVAPERITAMVTMSLGYSPRGEFQVPPFTQSRAWWYQWFLSVDRGAEAFAADPKGFARVQWETWSPVGWFTEEAFTGVAASFDNPDWIAITLSSYRSRWRDEPRDPRYELIEEQIAATTSLRVATLLIHGALDGTVLPESSAGKDGHFTTLYRRVVLEGVGHFPTREAPALTARLIVDHLSR